MKYRFRLIIAVFVFFFFKLTRAEGWNDFLIWDSISFVSLFYTLFVILAIWEIVSRSISFYGRNTDVTVTSGLYRLHAKTTLTSLPFVILFAIGYNLIIQTYFGGCCPKHEVGTGFWIDSAQGFVISLLIISYEIIRIYMRTAIKDAREKELIKKELAAARYEGLKNQVNPHFLFNSFSVLSSLVEKDSETAIEFISKLSDLYRYILENDDKSLVAISDEIAFLDDYLFLLKMRHGKSLSIEKNLEKLDLNAQIPPLSLQLLLENAVKHNSFSKEEPLKIILSAPNDKTVQLENRKAAKTELVKSTGIGLSNLSKRLQLLTGRGLTIVEDDITFKVSIPLN
ncbi:MAG: hypothetical protein Tsb0034_12020 [Ekhidna sp.]